MRRYIFIFVAVLVHGAIMAQCPYPYVLSGLELPRCEDDPPMTIQANDSEVGVSYQLLLNGSNYGAPLAGTGVQLSWGGIVTAGTYNVRATHLTSGCSNLLPWHNQYRNKVVINPAPQQFTVGGGGITICGNQTATVTLSGSQANVPYVLFRDGSSTGIVVMGTGQSLSWEVSTSGAYQVLALVACSEFMSTTANINILPLPTVYALSGTPHLLCPGQTSTITLSESQAGVNYQLKRDGLDVGQPVTKSGGPIVWSGQPPGVYSVMATRVDGMCISQTSNNYTITGVPSAVEFTLTASSFLCAGSSATLSGSEPGKNYRLNANGVLMPVVAGTGNPITWSDLQYAGRYRVIVSYPRGDGSTCTTELASQKTINEITAFPISGGYICPGMQGLPVTLNNSQAGLQYQLKFNGQPDGPPVEGTGSPITWADKTAGNYAVEAIYPEVGCSKPMAGTAAVTNAVINDYTVSLLKNGLNCGQNQIKLNSSQTGVSYKLKRDGVVSTNATQGNQSALTWSGIYSSGKYTVEANHVASGCVVEMPGHVDVSCDFDNLIALQNLTISASVLPSEYRLAVGGKILTAGINLKAPPNWPDYVFKKDYRLPSIEEVKNFIDVNNHLPNIPSAEEMKVQEYYGAGVLDRLLLEKIEELTLYTLDLHEDLGRIEKPGKILPTLAGNFARDLPTARNAVGEGQMKASSVVTSTLPSSTEKSIYLQSFSADVNVKQSLLIGRPMEIPSGYKLLVEGNILAAGLDIKATNNWPDYVFSEQYNLIPLKEIKVFVDRNGHLPGVPSAEQMNEAGHYDCAEIDGKLLEKVEELTLYVIDLKSRINKVNANGNQITTTSAAGFVPGSGAETISLKSAALTSFSDVPHPWDQKVLSSPGMQPFILPAATEDLEVVSVRNNVSVGTNRTVPNHKLVVAGNIIAAGAAFKPPHKWPDYVFDRDYDLPTLDELRSFIKENGHLPGMMSAMEMVHAGDYNLADMDSRLLEKIEELTLYVIQLQERLQGINNSSKD